MNTLQLAEAKSFLLKEIGDNPYHFSLDQSSDNYGGPTYVFNTFSEKGKPSTRYFVAVEDNRKIGDPFPEIENVATYKGDEEDMLRTLNVSFGAGPTIDDTDTFGLTSKGESLRVMATVMAIIRLEFRKHSRTQILTFMPSNLKDKDRDEQDSEEGTTNTRGRVYLGYIKSEFRDGISKGLVKIKIDGDEYIIKFDRDYLDKYLSSKS